MDGRWSALHPFQAVLFPVQPVQFFASPRDKEEPEQIKAEADKYGCFRKLGKLFDLRHHLGNAKENPQPCQYQHNRPDDLDSIHLFVGHQSTLSHRLLAIVFNRKRPAPISSVMGRSDLSPRTIF
jgi:hypothetical protein